MTDEPVLPKDGGVLIRLRVSPNARESGLQGAYGDSAVRVRVAAPPVEGKANAEVERFMAGIMGAPASEVRVVRGLSNRDKTVFVRGVGVARAREVLFSRRR